MQNRVRLSRLVLCLSVAEKMDPAKFGANWINCIGGACAKDKRFHARGLHPNSKGWPAYGKKIGVAAVVDFFGLTWRELCPVFGLYNDLDFRIKALKELIKRERRRVSQVKSRRRREAQAA